jgi:hypothetical protein
VAKRETKNAPIDYSGSDSNSMFGWCSTGQHQLCIIEFTGHRCSCECHGKVTNEKLDSE